MTRYPTYAFKSRKPVICNCAIRCDFTDIINNNSVARTNGCSEKARTVYTFTAAVHGQGRILSTHCAEVLINNFIFQIRIIRLKCISPCCCSRSYSIRKFVVSRCQIQARIATCCNFFGTEFVSHSGC